MGHVFSCEIEPYVCTTSQAMTNFQYSKSLSKILWSDIYEPQPTQYLSKTTIEINRLKRENQQLKEQLAFFLGSSNIQNNSTELYFAKKTFTQCDKQTIEYSMEYFFFTLTFDPDKFGYDNDPEDEEDYILIILHKLLKGKERYNVDSIYLCFEKTKAGVIHAHGVISSPAYSKVVKHYLKTCFTNNPRNRCAVQYEPAKAKCMNILINT